MWSILGDLKLTIRQLRRSGTFTFAVILTLALGIGLNAAIFTMVDSILLRPLGYHDANRIYAIETRFVAQNRSIPRIGGGDFTDLARQVSSLEYVAYYNDFRGGMQVGNRTLYTNAGIVSPEFGQVLGVEPVAGRLFHTDLNAPDGDNREAMVGAAFAREYFGSTAQAIGQTIKIEGQIRPIVGVLPDGFSFPDKTQVWVELRANPEIQDRTAYNQRAIGKLKPGVTQQALNAELATLSKQLSATYPEDKLKALTSVPLQDQIVGKVRPVLRLLMGSVIVILLIVCANITHLQLVRATRLRREITIRTALGATRSTLARRAGLEVLLLAVVGCAVGVLVALPALRLLIELAPQEIPRLADVRLNFDVIGFSFLVSLATMAITALLPLWRSWQVDPASAMKQDASRGLESHSSGRLRQGLIIGEVALTLTLIVAAMLLVRQLIAESKQDLGFVPDHLIMLDTHLISIPNGPADDATVSRMIAEIGNVPGISHAAAASSAPMLPSNSDVSYAIRGVSEFKPSNTNMPDANIMAMTPGYFETMGIPLIKGRDITDADRPGSQLVVVISESVARQSFAGVDPIGKQIMSGWDDIGGWHTIIGVVGDVRQESPASAPYPTLYLPLAQHPRNATDMQVLVRTHADAGAMAVTLTKLMKQQFPQVAVQASTMRENVGESQRAQHFRTLLFSSFAGVSILLAMTGMYGVTAYTVAQKRFELALRFALGAQRMQVLSSVLKSALTVTAIGIVAGFALSLGLMRVVSSLLGEMPAFDGVSYGLAAVGVLLIALSATLLPAYRAATVEPMQVLRSE